MKTCFKCGATKPLAEFYKHPEMADGYLGKCKACTRTDTAVNRSRRAEYYKAYDRERGRGEERKTAMRERGRRNRNESPERDRERVRRGRSLHPEKYRARYLMSN